MMTLNKKYGEEEEKETAVASSFSAAAVALRAPRGEWTT